MSDQTNTTTAPEKPMTRLQTGISWKDADKKREFDSALAAWQTENNGSVADFLYALMKAERQQSGQLELDARLERCGVAPLVDMHRRRAEADAVMLEQIATMILDSKAKAETEVAKELDGLRKSQAKLIDELEKAQEHFKETEAKLQAEKAEMDAYAASQKEAAQSAQAETKIARQSATDLKASLDVLTPQLDKAQAEKREIETELKERTKELLAAKDAASAATSQLEEERHQLTKETAKTQALELEITALKNQLTDAKKTLDQERQANAGIVAQLEKVKVEVKALEAALTTAKIENAEAKAKAQARAETITAQSGIVSALQKTLEALDINKADINKAQAK